MRVDEKIRLREIERRLSQVSDQLARLPVRFAQTSALGGEMVLVKIDNTLNVAAWNDTTKELTPGSAICVVMTWNPDDEKFTEGDIWTIYNTSSTRMYAAVPAAEAVFTLAARVGGSLFAVWPDFRAMENFSQAADQSIYHAAGLDRFVLGGEACPP
jgi:hypothetical protein